MNPTLPAADGDKMQGMVLYGPGFEGERRTRA
jgi:hypothetical protein